MTSPAKLVVSFAPVSEQNSWVQQILFRRSRRNRWLARPIFRAPLRQPLFAPDHTPRNFAR